MLCVGFMLVICSIMVLCLKIE